MGGGGGGGGGGGVAREGEYVGKKTARKNGKRPLFRPYHLFLTFAQKAKGNVGINTYAFTGLRH